MRLTAFGERLIVHAGSWAKVGITVSPLTVTAKWGYEEQLYEELRNLVEPARAEEGCIDYDVHRLLEDSGTFMFYENWESRSLS